MASPDANLRDRAGGQAHWFCRICGTFDGPISGETDLCDVCGPPGARVVWLVPAEKANDLAVKVNHLRAAIENYILWEPGRAGHAAAHRKLKEALDATR